MKTKLNLDPTSVWAILIARYLEGKAKEKGITLVALIITIIVLIILAAVTIFAFTKSGLLVTASKGTENYANAQGYEQRLMENIDKHAQNVVKNITEGRTGNDPDNGEEPTPPAPEEPQLPEGWEGAKVYAYESLDGKTVPVPIGFEVSDVETEKSVDTGLVIKIVQDGITSEFVWVPVANTSEMFGKDASGNFLGKLYVFSTSGASSNNWTERNGIMSLISSTSYREPDVVTYFDNTSSYYTNAGIKDKDGNDITNSAQFKKQLQEEFNEMKTSVETYKGFYIGRYETGNLSKTKAAVAKNNTDIGNQNWYAQYQKSKTIAEGTNATSSMIWGCQWDATMKWFLSSEDAGTRTYVINSTGKGNYSGTNGNEPIPTGLNDDYRVNNIYDMAGNVQEFNLTAQTNQSRVVRRRGLLVCWFELSSFLSLVHESLGKQYYQWV